MDGYGPPTHNYGPACARTGLATSRWASVALQKIKRLADGPLLESVEPLIPRLSDGFRSFRRALAFELL
jgi:hypothetical protein